MVRQLMTLWHAEIEDVGAAFQWGCSAAASCAADYWFLHSADTWNSFSNGAEQI